MAEERIYHDPAVIFGTGGGEKVDNRFIPGKSLVAAVPTIKEPSPTEPTQNTEYDAGQWHTPIEGKLPPPESEERIYHDPAVIFGEETKTIKTEPKDEHQFTGSYRRGGLSDVGGSKTATPIDFADTYTIPKAGHSVINPKTGKTEWTQYTPEELAANPGLNTEAQAESYFRSRMNNPNEPDSNKVAQAYLKMVGNDEYTKWKPAELAPQIDFSLAGQREYDKERAKYDADNNAAMAKANEAKRKVADEVAKGNFEYADQMVKEQALKVRLPDGKDKDGKEKQKEYRAASPEAAKNVLFLEKMNPVAKEAEEAIRKLDSTSSIIQVKQVAAKVARVAAMYYNPGQAVTMGDIGETEVANVAGDLEKAGLGSNMLVALISWFTMPEEEAKQYDGIVDFALKKFGNTAEPFKPSVAKEHLKATLEAAKKTKEEYYKAGAIVGYKGSGVAGGTDTQSEDPILAKWKPEQIPDKDFESTTNPNKDKLVLGSMLRWQKMTEPDQNEIELGIKSGYDGNAGVDAVQSYLKEKLGATSYNPTGILDPENDSKLVGLYFKKNPTKSAKDLISEALDYFEDDRPDAPTAPKKKTKGPRPVVAEKKELTQAEKLKARFGVK